MQISANDIDQQNATQAMASERTVDETLKLIDTVNNYPVLRQTDLKEYGRESPRDAAMRKLNKDFGQTRDKSF